MEHVSSLALLGKHTIYFHLEKEIEDIDLKFNKSTNSERLHIMILNKEGWISELPGLQI